MNGLISAKFTYQLAFSAMDEAPAWVVGHLILPKKTNMKDSWSICKEITHFFTSDRKIYIFDCESFSFHTNTNPSMCIEQSHSIL